MTPMTPEELYDFTYNDVMRKLTVAKVRTTHAQAYLSALTNTTDTHRTAHQRAQHIAQRQAYTDYLKRCKTEELLDM